MSYASDYDDFEQSAQGEDQDGSDFDEFCECWFGSSFGEMSCSEKGNAMFQWKLEQKEQRKKK